MMTEKQVRAVQLRNAGDWSGEKAVDAYRDGDEDTYCRLIAQADKLWAAADTLEWS
jgi:hypothetical protein